VDRHVAQVLLLAGLLLAAAGCGGTAPTAGSPSPTPDASQAFETAVASSAARINISVTDADTTLTAYQAGQLTDTLFLQRIQADYGQIALTDQAFIAQVGRVPFPAAMRADVATLVAAVQRHRDACQAVTQAALADLGAAIQAAADTNGDESAAVAQVRSDLAPAAVTSPAPGASPSPSPS
jgi:hypothetical protein